MNQSARIQLPPDARRGEVIEIRVLIQHPMETGFRYDALGQRTPRNAIHTLVCRYRGKEIFRASTSTGIAANPYLRFFTRATETGTIELEWEDDSRQRGTAAAQLVVVD